MDDTVKKVTDSFFATPEGRKVAERRGDFEALAASKDGESVMKMLGADVKRAAEKGDVSAISAAVQAVLKTDEGARLAKKISEMLK